ncbi:MAG TPA: amphi-Trp domain-containing protein [Nitrospirae bacterium]|nr:amphi-Trp domain-containing protein [Nitrospirota bacterium]
MGKRTINVKMVTDVDRVANFLSDLVSSIKDGTVCVQKGADFVTLTPMNDIEVEVEAKQKKNKESLILELSWKTRDDNADESIDIFKISSSQPEPEPEEEEATAEVSE